MAYRLRQSPLVRRMVSGAIWSLSGAIIARGLGLASSIIVARILGKAGFGELGIIQSTAAMFATFAGFGLGMTGTKFIAQYRTTDPDKAGRIRALSSVFAWVTSGITAAIVYLTAPWLATHVLSAPQVVEVLRISSLMLFLTTLGGAQVGILSGFEAFKTLARINLICGLCNFPIILSGAYWLGLTGVVWAMVIGAGLNWILNHFAIRSACRKAKVPYRYAGCLTERATLWQFALPSMISSLFFIPTEWALNALLVNQPSGYEDMGIFNAARQWHTIILYVPTAISNTTFPVLSNLLGEGRYREYQRTVLANSFLLAGIAAVFALPVALFSDDIMEIYGVGFAEGAAVLKLVCVYSVLWAGMLVVGQVLWTTGSSVIATLLAALRAALLLVIFIFLTPRTAMGLAVTFCITYALQAIYVGFISRMTVTRYLRERAPAQKASQ